MFKLTVELVAKIAAANAQDYPKQIRLWNIIDRCHEPEPLWWAQTEACGLNPAKVNANEFLTALHTGERDV